MFVKKFIPHYQGYYFPKGANAIILRILLKERCTLSIEKVSVHLNVVNQSKHLQLLCCILWSPALFRMKNQKTLYILKVLNVNREHLYA